jgi:hypothetical protein
MADKPATDIARKAKMRTRILLALCLMGGIALKLTFVFFCIGMLPAMVAYIIDDDKHKYIFSTVAAVNFAGVFPETIELFMQGGTFNAFSALLSDAVVWFTMYSAAAIGWALVWLSPTLAAMLLEGVYRGRLMHMESLQKKLEEEWGPEINRRK